MSPTVHPEKIKLHQLIDKMPNDSVDLLGPALSAIMDQKGVQAVFNARAMGAILKLSAEGNLAIPASASSEFDVLLSLLQHSEVQKILPTQDPLGQAKIRGLLAQQKLLQAEGGCIDADEAGKLLGLSRQGVVKRRTSGKLIGLLIGGAYNYPVWQFDQGQTLRGLERVLQTLAVKDPWMQTTWMLGGNGRLEGQSPLDALRQGKHIKVLRAASLYGKQGAT